jgi:hypothetical protein
MFGTARESLDDAVIAQLASRDFPGATASGVRTPAAEILRELAEGARKVLGE